AEREDDGEPAEVDPLRRSFIDAPGQHTHAHAVGRASAAHPGDRPARADRVAVTCLEIRSRNAPAGRRHLAAGRHAAELALELHGAFGDPRPKGLRLEQDGVTAEREDLADQPLVAPGGRLAQRSTVLELNRAPLDLPPSDRGRVPDPGSAGAAQEMRLEPLA